MRECNVGRELSTATLLMQPALRTPDRRSAAVRCSALAAPGNGSDSTADPPRVGRTYCSIMTSHSQRQGAVQCTPRRAGERAPRRTQPAARGDGPPNLLAENRTQQSRIVMLSWPNRELEFRLALAASPMRTRHGEETQQKRHRSTADIFGREPQSSRPTELASSPLGTRHRLCIE
jgi:hypothetical protein